MTDMTSLKTLLALKPSVLYPAHGPHVPTREAATKHLTDYISHRQQREDQLVALLQDLASDPTKLKNKLADLYEKVHQDQVAENKYNHEFLSGKPYKTKPPSKANEDEEEEFTPEELEERDRAERRAKIIAKFPQTKAANLPLICRLLYTSDKEGLINAASKSIGAHLLKLEQEGKVRKVKISLPKVTEGKISELHEEFEGWEWAGEIAAEEVKLKAKVD